MVLLSFLGTLIDGLFIKGKQKLVFCFVTNNVAELVASNKGRAGCLWLLSLVIADKYSVGLTICYPGYLQVSSDQELVLVPAHRTLLLKINITLLLNSLQDYRLPVCA